MSSGETVEFTWRLSESLWREGDYRGARAQLRPLLHERAPLSANVIIGTSVMLNIIEQSAEDYAEAARVLARTEGLVTACRTPVLVGKWCHAMALTRKNLRDPEGALPLYSEAVERFEAGGAVGFASTARLNVGNLFLSLGQPDIARPYVEQAIRDCEDEIALAQFRATEARLLLAEGDYERAEEVASESAEFLQLMGETTFAGESLKTLGEIRLVVRRVRARR